MFCRCGAPICGVRFKPRCCKTEQDPKTCDGIWLGRKGMRGFTKNLRKADSLE